MKSSVLLFLVVSFAALSLFAHDNDSLINEGDFNQMLLATAEECQAHLKTINADLDKMTPADRAWLLNSRAQAAVDITTGKTAVLRGVLNSSNTEHEVVEFWIAEQRAANCLLGKHK